jgi:hypothetical protein
MTLQPGQRLGPYEVEARLGAGGMGEVFRARDARLDRSVALKILPEELGADAARRERFEREARLVSSLAHPHICVLYDVGEADGRTFLVMEHLAGENLAERLARGPLPTRQVLRIGAEIAEALAHAHHQGIVHRDLKPGNVMLTPAGAKLLDFGLSKAAGAQPASGPTLTTLAGHPPPLTEEGTLLGTMPYMAPEQVEGRPADARSDIFALGAVLYEMATGRRAFDAKSRASLIAAILEHEPPALTSLQPLSPAALEHVVKICLAKEPERRWQDASDVAAQLRWLEEAGSSALGEPAAAARPARWRRLAGVAVAAAVVLAAAFLAGRRFQGAGTKPPLKAALVLPMAAGDFDSASLALAPDGRSIAFCAFSAGETPARVWVRPLGDDEARPVAGTEGASYPFWSPDSRHVAFFARGKLRRVPAAGGPVLTLADASSGRGGAWGAEGSVIFSPQPTSGLFEVPAGGGAVKQLTKPEAPSTTHRWPHLLPGGERLLYVVSGDPKGGNGLHLLDLASGTSRRVLDEIVDGRFAADRLLYHRDGNLIAQRFDPKSGTLSGTAEVVAPAAGISTYRWNAYAAATGETLVYVRNRVPLTALTWMDGSGRDAGVLGKVGPWSVVLFSPDATKAVVARDDGNGDDAWLADTADGSFRPLASGLVGIGAWSPAGDEVAIRVDTRAGSNEIRALAVNGSGGERTLVRGASYMRPTSWSPDGTLLYFQNGDLWAASTKGRGAPRAVIATAADEDEGVFSPDGRWVAFTSDETGRNEVYVAPYEHLGRKRRVSIDGGAGARWREGGRGLLFLGSDARVYRVEVAERDGQLHLGTPEVAFGGRSFAEVLGGDIAPSGDRGIVSLPQEAGPAVVHLVVGWPALLER